MNTRQVIDELCHRSPKEAWEFVARCVESICFDPMDRGNVIGELTSRDRSVGEIDHFLATAGWDLWQTYELAIERTSQRLERWWNGINEAKAILVLDGLSAREVPWILQGARDRGYHIGQVLVTGAELPGDTNTFARALGFSSRSQLQNHMGKSSLLNPCRTETIDLPWHDCMGLIDTTPNWIFWHHWPDNKLHADGGLGHGLDSLSLNMAEQLSSGEFWEFVGYLATGRRLIITSDHGYAATNLFFDGAGEQNQFLKELFRGGRFIEGFRDVGRFVPPLAMNLASSRGNFTYALGRRKWKSPGGYPSLVHGGLSILEMLSPFVELYA